MVSTVSCDPGPCTHLQGLGDVAAVAVVLEHRLVHGGACQLPLPLHRLQRLKPTFPARIALHVWVCVCVVHRAWLYSI